MKISLKNKNKAYLLLPFFLAVPLTGGLTFPSCTVQKNDGGLYKTSDGTQTWKQVTTIEDAKKTSLAKSDTVQLVSDPNNPDVVFLVTKSDGLYVSNQFGDSWKRILPEAQMIYTIEPNTSNKGDFYVSALINNRGKIVETKNGGTDWEEIYSETGKGTYIQYIKSDPFNNNVITAINSTGLMVQSKDNGQTWQATFLFQENVIDFFYDKSIQGKIWVLTNKGIWHSENGGSNFELLNLGNDDKMGTQFYLMTELENNIFLSSDKGFFRSADSGAHWEKIITLNDPATYPVISFASYPEDPNKWAIGAGMTMYLTADHGQSWKSVQFEIDRWVNSILIKSNDPKQMVVGVLTHATSNYTGF